MSYNITSKGKFSDHLAVQINRFQPRKAPNRKCIILLSAIQCCDSLKCGGIVTPPAMPQSMLPGRIRIP